ncbi:hemin uptake protein HemP [Guyparkeria hydrothermalis]|uniref:hemin uptake protein HemP n=1 Tax=Guyparkeria hydrothermalis TaxID=923 RepID=UPI00201FD017|nr:hemin uptake protein HemP [Guyparkeria hydrothermalis]MCL7745302.1 hemin uptake protein HemP [Guyparkeria hydrothermalis]
MSDKTAAPIPRLTEIPRVSSQALLGDHGQLWIDHQGQRYLLKTTASNKLILTK